MVNKEGQEVIIWTGRGCSACVQAKQFFERKRIEYTERRLKTDRVTQTTFMRATGGAKTVPQIFIGRVHVGGLDDLVNLDRRGELEAVLSGEEVASPPSLWRRLFRSRTP